MVKPISRKVIKELKSQYIPYATRLKNKNKKILRTSPLYANLEIFLNYELKVAWTEW